MENDLQINITAVDEASGTLDNVAESAENMATSIGEAASSISETLDVAFSAAEQAAVDAALASANAWIDATEEIDSAVGTVVEASESGWSDISDSSLAAANASSESWQTSLEEIASLGTMTETEVDAAFVAMSDGAATAADKATSSMEGAMSVFRILMIANLAKQASSGLQGILDTLITAAAGDPTKLSQAQDQMAQLKAQRDQLEQPISGKGKTTGELGAAESQQAAGLATVNEKIKELQPQLDQLQQAQQIGGQAAKDYDAAALKLTQDWQTFLETAGAPLLANAAKTAVALDEIVTKVTEFAAAHPKVVEAVGLTIAVLAGFFAILSTIFAILVPIILVMWLFSIPFTAGAVAIGLAIAAIVVVVIFLGAMIVTHWGEMSAFIVKLWDDIVGFIKDHWQLILAILLPGIGALVDYMFDHWTQIKTGVEDAWNWIYNFIAGIWGKIVSAAETAIGSVQKLIAGIMAPINAVTSAVSSIGGAIGNGAGSLLSAIPKFADGGIVSSPTLALIGEAGPEAVIPLSAFNGGSSLSGGASGGSGNIVINLSGNFYGSDNAMMSKLSTYLGKMIGQQIKLKAH